MHILNTVFFSFSVKLFCMYLPSLGPLLVLDLSTQWCAFLQFSADVRVFPGLTGNGVAAFPDIRPPVIIAQRCC